MSLTESVVEQAALDWLHRLGYETLSGLTIAPAEPTAERWDYKQVFLFNQLRNKLKDLNPGIPHEGLEEALRKIRLILELKNITDASATIRVRLINCKLTKHKSRPAVRLS
jgi:type I site-specific restriction-modification system R (restriction) subunit